MDEKTRSSTEKGHTDTEKEKQPVRQKKETEQQSSFQPYSTETMWKNPHIG